MDAIAILKKVAKACPWYATEDGVACAMCGVEVNGWVSGDNWDEAVGWIEDECNHDEECPWRLAVEYLANLDNDGFLDSLS